jgi:hypothetical protein
MMSILRFAAGVLAKVVGALVAEKPKQAMEMLGAAVGTAWRKLRDVR